MVLAAPPAAGPLRIVLEEGDSSGLAMGVARLPQPAFKPIWGGDVWRLHADDGFGFAVGEHLPPIEGWPCVRLGDTVALALRGGELTVRVNGGAEIRAAAGAGLADGGLRFFVEVFEGCVVRLE